MGNSKRSLVVFILLLLVVVPVLRADEPAPKDKSAPAPAAKVDKEEKKPDAEDKEKDKQDSAPQGVIAQVNAQADSLQQFTTTLSSTVAALIAVQTIPSSFKNSGQAIANMRNFGKNREEYLRLHDELKKFMETKDEKLADLNLAIRRYDPVLKELDEHMKTVLGGQPSNLEDRYKAVEWDIQNLMELPEASRWQIELKQALEAWKTDRRDYPIESWIARRLGTKFMAEGPGAEWLQTYTRHKKELAASFWLEKGSMLLMDQWFERNEGRKAIFDDKEQKWQKEFRKLKSDELKAANTFLREFATFTRELNANIKDPKHKFSELLVWANRDPGMFHTSDNGTPIPISAAKLASYAAERCAQGMRTLGDALSAARQIGSFVTLPWQGLRAVAPALSAGVTGITGYVSVRGLIRMWQQATNGQDATKKADGTAPKDGTQTSKK